MYPAKGYGAPNLINRHHRGRYFDYHNSNNVVKIDRGTVTPHDVGLQHSRSYVYQPENRSCFSNHKACTAIFLEPPDMGGTNDHSLFWSVLEVTRAMETGKKHVQYWHTIGDCKTECYVLLGCIMQGTGKLIPQQTASRSIVNFCIRHTSLSEYSTNKNVKT